PITYVVYYFIYLSVFYTNAYLFNRINKQKTTIRILFIPTIIVAEIVIFGLINFYLEKTMIYFGLMEVPGGIKLTFVSAAMTAWRLLYFIGFSTGYVYILKSMEESKRTEELRRQNLENTIYNQRLENELVKVENDYLRSQINPHFLFNTLSFIYNGTRKTAPDAASAILSLSDMMRYALKQPGSSDTIYINDEVEQVENLINLHKLRTKNSVFVDLEISGDLTGVKFLPLMLLTLVENVFKHGNLSNQANPGKIKVEYLNNKLIISTRNLIAEKQHGESNSVGMENIRKRLDGFYKGTASLNYSKIETNAFYTEIVVENVN
ncbi:MAG: hypothetical protein EOO89_10900, partial [Pedobacter sp.]